MLISDAHLVMLIRMGITNEHHSRAGVRIVKLVYIYIY